MADPGFDLSRTFVSGTPSGGFSEVNNRFVEAFSAGSGFRSAVGFGSRNSGKVYFEVTATGGNSCFIGWYRAAAIPTDLAGAPNTSSAGYFYINILSNQFTSQETGTIALGTSGDGTYMFALDLSSNRHWIGKNGTWLTGNPSTNTAPFFTNTIALGAAGARVQAGFGDSSARFLSLESELLYPLPTGFSPWSVPDAPSAGPRFSLLPVDPYTTPFDRWASDMTEQLSGYNAPAPAGEAAWERWAEIIVGLPPVVELGAPEPRQFARWQDWAARLLSAA